MFGMTVWILGVQRGLRGSHIMLVTAFLLWALPTIRLCIDINLTVTAFVDHIDEGQLGPQKYLSTFSTPVSLTDNAIYGLQTLIGDAVVIYRCYIVWQTWWVIVLPCIAWVGGLGSMMYILYMFASGVINGERGLLIYIFTFVANGSATAFLAYKIWTVERDARKSGVKRGHSGLWPVILVIVESGALYTAILIVALVTAIHALQVEYVINSFIPALISVIFNTIFIRIGLSRRSNSTSGGSDSAPLESVVFAPATFHSTEKDFGTHLATNHPALLQSSSSAGESEISPV
ncbi:uncharacterized protein B0H18DRAFT_1050307 [Fomitopsis serialis]|uniref:uncharacterized protein n=1 Tax=Fomitopsis serialis TaxID=139415 RepID=UPI0020074450|nr:uncharacterized protein B0H18DRAFT_1050307 [Neoantrodia serialis]KAH9913209.1 hypothetical protein B0H18DRAFT_1050307 [Neoantrodia serialis]